MWSEEDIEENIIEYKWNNKWGEELARLTQSLHLARLTQSLHSRRPDPPAAPANPPFLWYKPFLNLSYSVRTRKHFYTAVKIGFASKEGLATDVLSLLSRLMMIFKFPKLIGRARNGTRTLTARSEKNEFIFVDTLVFSMRKADWPTDIRPTHC